MTFSNGEGKISQTTTIQSAIALPVPLITTSNETDEQDNQPSATTQLNFTYYITCKSVSLS